MKLQNYVFLSVQYFDISDIGASTNTWSYISHWRRGCWIWYII